MLLPSVRIKCRAGRTRFTSLLLGGVPTKRLMNATAVVITTELPQLSLQIKRIPKEYAIKILSAQGPDQPLHKRMRSGNVGNGLDLVDFKYAQIR